MKKGEIKINKVNINPSLVNTCRDLIFIYCDLYLEGGDPISKKQRDDFYLTVTKLMFHCKLSEINAENISRILDIPLEFCKNAINYVNSPIKLEVRNTNNKYLNKSIHEEEYTERGSEGEILNREEDEFFYSINKAKNKDVNKNDSDPYHNSVIVGSLPGIQSYGFTTIDVSDYSFEPKNTLEEKLRWVDEFLNPVNSEQVIHSQKQEDAEMK